MIHVVWAFFATVLLGLLVIDLPQGVSRLSVEGLTISITGPFIFCFLPSVAISLIVAGIYYFFKKKKLTSFKYVLWTIWLIPAFLLLIGATSSVGNAGDISADAKSGKIQMKLGKPWVSEVEKFGALFPSTPETINLSNTETTAKRYYALKQYSEGSAQFSITTSPLKNRVTDYETQRKLLNLIMSSQLSSAGAIKETVKTKSSNFGDGRPQLFYEFNFFEQKYPLSSKGFYVIDGARIINISVMYSAILPKAEENEITGFLGTFTLLK